MADRNKRKKAAYFGKCGAKRSRTQFTLQPGLKGFLATCNFREKDCVREAINILSEFSDRIYGEDKSAIEDSQPQNKKIVFKGSDSEDEEEEDDNIESALAREVTALKEVRQNKHGRQRFQVVESGADNCVFIRSTVEDPVSVVEAILKEIEDLSKQKTRFLLRLLPIEITCKAWPEDIKKASGLLFDKYFKGEPKTFCIVYKRRNNNNVLREELIHELAGDIKLCNPLHRADMKQPDLAVIVEVIRNICCMSVVPKYFHYRKYNLLEVAKIKNSPRNSLQVKDEAPVKTETITEEDASGIQTKECLSHNQEESKAELKTESSEIKSELCDVPSTANNDKTDNDKTVEVSGNQVETQSDCHSWRC